MPRRTASRSSASIARGTRRRSCPGRGAAAAAAPRRARGRARRRQAPRRARASPSRQAPRTPRRTDGRRSPSPRTRRAPSTPPRGRAAAERRRRCRRARASPCGRARPPRPRRREALASGGDDRKVSVGRRRLPPAASASAPTAATVPGCASTTCDEPRLDGVEVLGEPGRRPDGRERAQRRTPCVERDDRRPEQAEANLLEPLALEERGEILGAREAPDAGRQVRVRLAARQHLAEQRHDRGRTRARRTA